MKFIAAIASVSVLAVACGGNSGQGTLAQDVVPQPCVAEQTGTVRVVNSGSVVLYAAVNTGSTHTLSPGQSFSVDLPVGSATVYTQCDAGGVLVQGQDTVQVQDCVTTTSQESPCG